MKKIIFATNNAHKLSEVREILAAKYEVVSLADIGFTDDIAEPYDTFEENALVKARTIAQQMGYDCFGEDTGLIIDALGGEPGVKSARYAGEGRSTDANVDLVLQKMQGITNRQARFKTVVALLLGGNEYLFEGVVEGTILTERCGTSGFGYDPIFVPTGYSQTFAQMPAELKNNISHRAKAVEKLVAFLTKG